MTALKWFFVPMLAGSLVLGISCGKQEVEWDGTIETKDGAIIVNNPEEPIFKDPVVELMEDLEIKGSGEIEEQMFQSINTLDVDPAGNMYILDEQAGNIKIFDSSGNFQKTIGRKGQGPGEFGLPISLFLTRQNQIIVNDMGQRKIQFFDKEGNYLKEYSIAERFLFFGPMVTANGDLIASHTIPQEKSVTVLGKFNPGFEPTLTYASIPLDTPPVVNIFVARSLTSLRWTLTYDDEIIWGDIKNPEYEIHFLRADGTLKKTIKRDYDPIPITADDKDRLMEETFGDNPARDQWDVQFPENYPPFSGFSFDDLGHLFVRRYEKEKNENGSLYDIFDAEGRYIAQMRFRMTPMIWEKGHMYTIDDDEEGFKVVKRYKVRWKI